MDHDLRLIYTTWPNAENAASVARTLVEERLAACANVLPGALSVYWWEGRVDAETEAVVFFKTTGLQAPRLRRRIMELHPYETPAIVSIKPEEDGSNLAFVDWVARETSVQA